MTRAARAAAAMCCAALSACATTETEVPVVPSMPLTAPPPDPEEADEAPASPPTPPDAAPLIDAPPSIDVPAAVSGAIAMPSMERVWLRGALHVHAKPSGDSTEPIANVITWYEKHDYDFIVLTDHNKVSEIAPDQHTDGQRTVRAPDKGLIVFAGSELTHNPSGCVPAGDASKKCRIHVNAIGVTARPIGKIDWANRKTHDRVEKYQAAFDEAKTLGAALVQINHPQWFWGMQPHVLVELAKRGAQLVEIDNAQFRPWSAGDATHPSTEKLWDAVLATGATMWGTASDDAHDYHGRGKWPPGGAWVVVHARRDPSAILAALAAGQFYASNGVVLARAEPENGALVVEVAAGDTHGYDIAWIENGAEVARVHARSASRPLPATGYVRADVIRDDGKRAWVEPARK